MVVVKIYIYVACVQYKDAQPENVCWNSYSELENARNKKLGDRTTVFPHTNLAYTNSWYQPGVRLQVGLRDQVFTSQ